MTKAAALNQLYRIDQELEALFRQLAAYDEAALNQRPADGGWSVMQVLHHLILAESASLAYVRKKLSFKPALKPAGFRAAWRVMVVKAYFKMPVRFKAPKGVDDAALPERSEYTQTERQWRNSREELKKYLLHLPDTYFGREVYKHPFAGRMSLRGMLEFFGMHVRRHRQQINRVLKEVA